MLLAVSIRASLYLFFFHVPVQISRELVVWLAVALQQTEGEGRQAASWRTETVEVSREEQPWAQASVPCT